MKATEILEILEENFALPRGLAVHSGKIFNHSLEREGKHVLIVQGRFLDDERYFEFQETGIPQRMWNVVEDCDVEVKFDFGNYRYLRIE